MFKKVYNMLYNDVFYNPNRQNWCSLVKNLLSELGFIDAWIIQTVGDANLFLFNVKQRIRDQFIQKWNERLNNSTRVIFIEM